MPLFGKGKSPKDQMILLNENLQALNKDRRKVAEVTKSLMALRDLVSDKSDTRLTGKEKDAEFSQAERTRINETLIEITSELINLNMLPTLLSCMESMEFEGRKLVASLFGHIMRREVGKFSAAAQYLFNDQPTLLSLIKGYEKPDCALQYGSMLRDACRHECLAKVFLYSNEFCDLFNHVQGTAFDVSSDAFSTLRDLLRHHKTLVSEFLTAKYHEFFTQYQSMLSSANYVTKRQALKLLGELLLERKNFTIMTSYIADPANLKSIMIDLRSEHKQIAFEAFHCFKIFVANPTKTEAVNSILWRNKDRMVEFLSKFQIERVDDAAFNEEKTYIIKLIRELKEPPPSSSAVRSSVGHPPASNAASTTALPH